MSFPSQKENRDVNGLNDHLKVDFSHVIAEPSSSVHSYFYVWVFSKYCYGCCLNFHYNLCALFCAICVSVFWGVQFAIIAFEHVWLKTPFTKCFDLTILSCSRLIRPVVQCMILPFTEACGQVFVSCAHLSYRNEVQNLEIDSKNGKAGPTLNLNGRYRRVHYKAQLVDELKDNENKNELSNQNSYRNLDTKRRSVNIQDDILHEKDAGSNSAGKSISSKRGSIAYQENASQEKSQTQTSKLSSSVTSKLLNPTLQTEMETNKRTEHTPIQETNKRKRPSQILVKPYDSNETSKRSEMQNETTHEDREITNSPVSSRDVHLTNTHNSQSETILSSRNEKNMLRKPETNNRVHQNITRRYINEQNPKNLTAPAITRNGHNQMRKLESDRQIKNTVRHPIQERHKSVRELLADNRRSKEIKQNTSVTRWRY